MKKFSLISASTLALIFMAGLVTNGAVEKPICTDLNDQRYPAISGNLILWTDIRKGKWNTYMYDLSTGNKNRITSSLNSQHYPAISGDRIIWEDYRNGNGDIYMYDLSLAPILCPLLPVRTPISIKSKTASWTFEVASYVPPSRIKKGVSH